MLLAGLLPDRIKSLASASGTDLVIDRLREDPTSARHLRRAVPERAATVRAESRRSLWTAAQLADTERRAEKDDQQGRQTFSVSGN